MKMAIITLLPVLVLSIAIMMVSMAVGYSIAFIIWITASALALVLRPHKVKIIVHPPVQPVLDEYWNAQSVPIRLERSVA